MIDSFTHFSKTIKEIGACAGPWSTATEMRSEDYNLETIGLRFQA